MLILVVQYCKADDLNGYEESVRSIYNHSMTLCVILQIRFFKKFLTFHLKL